MKVLISRVLIVSAAGFVVPAWCHADGFSFGIGSDYSSGKYGGVDRTTITSVPIHAKYTSGPVTFKVSVPWLHISGAGAVVPSGLGGIGGSGSDSSGSSGGSANSSGGSIGVFGCAADNRGGASKPEDDGPCAGTTTTVVTAGGGTVVVPARRTEEGFGDIVAALTYNAINSNGLLLDVTGKVKFATASESRGLGSGKNDYALQFEAEKSIGKFYINAGLGYKWLGDPTGISLRNVWYGALGGGYKVTPETTIGVSYDHASSARNNGPSVQEVSTYVSHRITKAVRLNGSVFKGLSNAVPNWGAGVGLSYAF